MDGPNYIFLMPTALNQENSYYDQADLKVWQAFKKLDDKKAFEHIYTENIDQLYNYGLKIFQDGHVVEDCIQELFINLWDQRKNLADTDNIHFYLMKALRWKIIKHIDKKHKKLKKIKDNFELLKGEVVLPYEDHLISDQLDMEKRRELRIALNKLPDRQREVIHLIFFRKMSYEEVSEIMFINLKSVYTLAWKALSNLKKTILVLVFTVQLAF